MKELKKYDINLAKLSFKTHRFEFNLDDDFFALFEQSYIIHGNLDAIIDLERTERLITLHFSIKGEVQLICDRSLEEFMHPIDVQETLILKFGEEEKELSEDILQITNDTQSINVAQHLFDYIGLAVPMKKLHPRYQTEDNEDSEQDILIFSTSTDRGMIDDEDDNNDDNPD
ncbi:MAG: DUF177 domain-containing protein, partial [Proteobacteria bacterium]